MATIIMLLWYGFKENDIMNRDTSGTLYGENRKNGIGICR